MATVGFSPSHRVPDGGLDTWASPDTALPVAARLDARLDVQILQWWGDWAEIRCSNEWTAWLDGRYLEAAPVAAQAAAANVRLGQLARSPAVIGAAVMAFATVLPWIRSQNHSSNSFKIPISFLLDYKKAGHKAGVISLGSFLLVCSFGAVALSAAQWVMPASAMVRRAAGGLAVVLTFLFVVQLHRLLAAFPGSPSLTSTIGAGFVCALAGGVAVVTGPRVGGRAVGGRRG
jgi:hypothetical protein